MKRIFTLVFIFLFQFSLFSQGPGFMGKKFTVGYGCNTNPLIIGQGIVNSFSGDTIGFEPSFVQEGYLEYAAANRWLFGTTFKYYKTTYQNDIEMFVYGKPTSHYKINGLSFNLMAKYFYGPYLAPWGKYYTAGIAINTVKTSYDKYMYIKQETSGHDTLISNFGPKKDSRIHLDLIIGKGRSKILANKIILDYGYNIQVVAALYKLGSFGFSDFFKPNVNMDNYISKTARRKSYEINCANVFIKIGYLF